MCVCGCKSGANGRQHMLSKIPEVIFTSWDIVTEVCFGLFHLVLSSLDYLFFMVFFHNCYCFPVILRNHHGSNGVLHMNMHCRQTAYSSFCCYCNGGVTCCLELVALHGLWPTNMFRAGDECLRVFSTYHFKDLTLVFPGKLRGPPRVGDTDTNTESARVIFTNIRREQVA